MYTTSKQLSEKLPVAQVMKGFEFASKAVQAGPSSNHVHITTTFCALLLEMETRLKALIHLMILLMDLTILCDLYVYNYTKNVI